MRPPTIALHLLLFLFLASPATCDKPGEAVGGAWLQMTQSLTRHSDRAAQRDDYITDAAASQFFRGKGQLSTEGLDHARATGASFRSHYIENRPSPFIDGRLIPKEVLFRASEVERVEMTASNFASGLFSDGGVTGVPPIEVTPYGSDQLLAMPLTCTLGWEDVTNAYNITASSDMPDDLLAAMRGAEWPCNDPPAEQSDTLLSEFFNTATKAELTESQVDCASEPAQQFMLKYVSILGGSGTNNTEARARKIRTVGALANDTIQRFLNMRACYAFSTEECDPFRQMAVFNNAHDVHVVGLIDVFTFQRGASDILRGLTPNFTVSLVLEMWVKNNRNYIKAFVKNGINNEYEELLLGNYLPATPDYPRVGRYPTIEALNRAKEFYINTNNIEC